MQCNATAQVPFLVQNKYKIEKENNDFVLVINLMCWTEWWMVEIKLEAGVVINNRWAGVKLLSCLSVKALGI